MKISKMAFRINKEYLFARLLAVILIITVMLLAACDHEGQVATKELIDRIADLEATNNELRGQINKLEEREDYNGKEINMGDFSVVLTVDKTEVNVGESIFATFTLKNISRHDITLEIPDWIACLGKKRKEDIIEFAFSPEKLEAAWFFEAVAVLERPKVTIAKDEIIERTVKYEVTEKDNLIVNAGAFYYLTDSSGNVVSKVHLYSKTIKIKVNF